MDRIALVGYGFNFLGMTIIFVIGTVIGVGLMLAAPIAKKL